jgi:hypothetical protein
MSKQTSRSVEEIQAELARVQAAFRAYRQQHRGPFKEDMSGRAEALVQAARGRLDALAAQSVTWPPPLGTQQSLAFAEACAWCSPQAEAALKAAAERLAEDAEPKAEVERVFAEYEQKIDELQKELRESQKAARIAEVEAEFEVVA